MPHACSTVRPCRSNARIIDSGAAEPPTTMRQPGVSVRGARSSCSRIAVQIVGTPAATVTCSPSIRSSRLLASRAGPGITSLAPAVTAPNGMPHALAWNIGTTGSTVSRCPRPSPSVISVASECSTVDRCEYTTPLGCPVVPDV